MSIEPDRPETLEDIKKHLRKLLAQAAQSEGQLAKEVMKLEPIWPAKWEAKAGATLIKWLKANVDPRRNMDWYRNTALQYKTVGPVLSRMLHRTAVTRLANWLGSTGEITFHIRRTIENAYNTRNRRMPLSVSQLVALFPEMPSHQSAAPGLRDRIRDLELHIERLEAQVRKLGAEPVD